MGGEEQAENAPGGHLHEQRPGAPEVLGMGPLCELEWRLRGMRGHGWLKMSVFIPEASSCQTLLQQFKPITGKPEVENGLNHSFI